MRMFRDNSFDAKQLSNHETHIHSNRSTQMAMDNINMFSNKNLPQQRHHIQRTKKGNIISQHRQQRQMINFEAVGHDAHTFPREVVHVRHHDNLVSSFDEALG